MESASEKSYYRTLAVRSIFDLECFWVGVFGNIYWECLDQTTKRDETPGRIDNLVTSIFVSGVVE